MAEMMEALVPVSMGLGHLTDEEYEDLVVAAMPSMTEVALVEIAVEPEKPASEIAVETALVQPFKAKPPRVCGVCGKCGHADGNSVGRIKLGRIVEIVRDELKLHAVEPTCNVCVGRMAPAEKAKIRKIGFLISEVGLANRQVYVERDALAYWTEFKAGTAMPLQARRNQDGRVVCGVPGCKLCRDGEFAVRFTIVKNGDKREVAGFCREQFAALIKAGALRSVQLFDYRGAMFEINRRDKKDAGEIASSPKQPEPSAVTEIVAEPEKPAPAKPQLTRAEREARRWDRRRKLALAVGNTRFGAGKRHKGGQKGSNGGGKKR